MNFFESQADARKSSSRLVGFFVLAVLCIVVALYFVFASVSVYGGDDPVGASWWIPEVFLWTFVCTIGVIGLTSLVKISSLSAGGSVVAEWMGGRLIDSGTKDKNERRLINIVEEMAIASGVPVPSVYVMDQDGINAFAAGHSSDDAAVAVTTGCMEQLSRDELQGVIAHEFSHVLNGDMKLNIRLIGILAGILVIGVTGAWVLRIAALSGRGSRREGGGAAVAFMVLGVSLMVIGYVGVFFGNIIKSAVSRQREYLADASAVQFTRNPNGIGGALKKILDSSHGSSLEHKRTDELSHMFFARGLSGGFFSGMFSTHPPLEERIERIAGVGAMQADAVISPAAPVSTPVSDGAPTPDASAGKTARMTAVLAAGMLGGSATALALDPKAVMDQVGKPTEQHLALGAQLIATVPTDLRDATASSLGAVAVVYGVLLDDDDKVRRIQLEHLASNADRGVGAELKRLLAQFSGLDPRLRLVLIDLSLPALRQLVRSQFEEMRANVEFLVYADEKVTLFEFCLEKTLQVSLDANFSPRKKKASSYGTLRAVVADVSTILSALAHAGQDTLEEARHAFDVGVERFPEADRGAFSFQPEEAGFRNLDAALDRVACAQPAIKEQVLEACVHVALADGTVTVEEGEMLRAVAHVMGCPVPPLLANER